MALEQQRQQVIDSLLAKKVEHKRLLEASERNTQSMVIPRPQQLSAPQHQVINEEVLTRRQIKNTPLQYKN